MLANHGDIRRETSRLSLVRLRPRPPIGHLLLWIKPVNARFSRSRCDRSDPLVCEIGCVRRISHMLRPKSHEVATQEKRFYRVSAMGPAAVGKTCIISRFINRTFDATYKSTMEDFHLRIFGQENGRQFVFDIVDMLGKDWRSLLPTDSCWFTPMKIRRHSNTWSNGASRSSTRSEAPRLQWLEHRVRSGVGQRWR